MKLRVALVGLAAVAVVGAVAWYLTAAPGMLAGDYRDQARPEHEKLARAVRDLGVNFQLNTFGWADYEALDRTKTPDQYLRLLRRTTAAHRRELVRVRGVVRRARSTLGALDEEALLDVPAWPALEGRDELGRAEEISADERDYLRRARVLVRDYRRLVDYTLVELRVATSVARIVSVDLTRLARRAESVSISRSAAGLDRLADRLDRQARAFGRRKPPPGLRVGHRRSAASVRAQAREVRRLAGAVRRLDRAGIQAFDRRFPAIADREDRRARRALERLIANSHYRRLLTGLGRLDRRIQAGYEEL